MWTWSAFSRRHSIVPCPITIIYTMPEPPWHMLRVSLFSHIFGSTRIFTVCYREKERHANLIVLPKQDVQQEVNRGKIWYFNSSREWDLVFRLRYLSCVCKRLEGTCSLFRAGLSPSICWYLSENVGIIWLRNDGTFLTHHLPEERRSEHLWNVDGFLKMNGEISIATMVPF